MIKKKIPIEIGIGIIIIIAITVGMFVWKYEKNVPSFNQSQNIVKVEKAETSLTPESNQQEMVQPIMPSLKDEFNKSPELLVKDFYNWYIGSVDYSYYQLYKLREKNPINIKTLIESSPFISANYSQNIEKRKGMYDAVLCTNDNEFNTVKDYGKAQISGNSAKVDILRGYTRNENTTKIQILLIKKGGQWKIDDIICDF